MVGGQFASINGAPRTNLARLHPDGRLDENFSASVSATSANAYVWPIALQLDERILVGGSFTEVNGVACNRVVRLNPDGSIDSGFNPGSGADHITTAIVLEPDGQILVGGRFTHFNGVSRGGITRLNANGAMDASFNPGTGANGAVGAIVLQPDGKIVVGGSFSTFNGVPCARLARLNPDGSLDATFVPYAPEGTVYGLVLQADGKRVAGALPTLGFPTARVARFNPNGSMDSSFALGFCGDHGIWCLTGLANGQIMAGGDFTDYNGVPAGHIVRLHGDEAITVLPPFWLGTRWSGGVFELGLFGEAGRSYTIEASTGLPAFSVWTNLTSAGTNWLADPGSPATPQRFYRARTTN
ncbi:MAG: hypothetical protein NT154_27585 [Verrucomicrobia bacterium]|nr:hypothetical protein [Verrucomicrobiota bacterium]